MEELKKVWSLRVKSEKIFTVSFEEDVTKEEAIAIFNQGLEEDVINEETVYEHAYKVQ